jgi:four helix bundle protein
MRRSAVSIPSSIAEGYARETKPSYVQFLRTARGSLRELETQLLISQRVGMLEENDVALALEKCDAVARKLHGLIRSLQTD